MKESTATIKLTKSEMEWTIIALVWMEKSSEEFRRPHDASMFKKLREDFIKIKEEIIHGEKQLEKKQYSEKEVSSSQKPCKNCS